MSNPLPPDIDIEAAPASSYQLNLLAQFALEVSEQVQRLDELAKQLLTLNLAIPALYATILKLVSGEDATVNDPVLILITFGAWCLALGLSIAALYPQSYSVDPDSPSEIEAYYTQAAKHKRNLLASACVCSFFGICFAVFSLF
jgi:hypothetical protein